MRPTCLKFRHPKERTGEYLFPMVTHDGKSLTTIPPYTELKSTFPRSLRFGQFEEIAKRTGLLLGPGSYDVKLSTNRGHATVIKPDYGIPSQIEPNTEYVYFDSCLVKQEKRNLIRSQSQPRFFNSTERGSIDFPQVSSIPVKRHQRQSSTATENLIKQQKIYQSNSPARQRPPRPRREEDREARKAMMRNQNQSLNILRKPETADGQMLNSERSERKGTSSYYLKSLENPYLKGPQPVKKIKIKRDSLTTRMSTDMETSAVDFGPLQFLVLKRPCVSSLQNRRREN